MTITAVDDPCLVPTAVRCGEGDQDSGPVTALATRLIDGQSALPVRAYQ